MKIKDIAEVIERYAPLRLQESYDNAGLIVGRPEDEVHKALLAVDDGANLGHLGPGVAGGGLLQDDGTKEIRSLRGRDELHIAKEALPLLFSPDVRPLVERYFEQARSVEHAAYRRFSCIHP